MLSFLNRPCGILPYGKEVFSDAQTVGAFSGGPASKAGPGFWGSGLHQLSASEPKGSRQGVLSGAEAGKGALLHPVPPRRLQRQHHSFTRTTCFSATSASRIRTRYCTPCSFGNDTAWRSTSGAGLPKRDRAHPPMFRCVALGVCHRVSHSAPKS